MPDAAVAPGASGVVPRPLMVNMGGIHAVADFSMADMPLRRLSSDVVDETGGHTTATRRLTRRLSSDIVELDLTNRQHTNQLAVADQTHHSSGDQAEKEAAGAGAEAVDQPARHSWSASAATAPNEQQRVGRDPSYDGEYVGKKEFIAGDRAHYTLERGLGPRRAVEVGTAGGVFYGTVRQMSEDREFTTESMV